MERGELVLTGVLVLAVAGGAVFGISAGRSNRMHPVVVDGEPAPPAVGEISRAAASGGRAEISDRSWKRDVNAATAAELSEANGIGEVLSTEIVRYRESHGPFRSMEDLLDVPGIGPSRLENLRRLFDVLGATGDSSPEPGVRPAAGEPGHASRVEEPERAVPEYPSGGRADLGGAGVPGESADGRIDLNTASRSLLQDVPGIGPALSERIVRYREENGPFGSVEELVNVSGIGDKRCRAFAPYLRVASGGDREKRWEPPESAIYSTGPGSSSAPRGPDAPPGYAPADPGVRSFSDGAPVSPGGRIDLNRATKEELMALPGIGAVLADRIIEERTRGGPFRTAAEVQRVSGIGPKTFEKIQRLVVVSP